MKIRIKITRWGNDEMTYHFNTEVSQSKFQDFWRPLDESSSEYLQKVGDLGLKIVKAVMQLEGVARVHIKPYELQVRKGEAFEWEEITPKVNEILTKVFADRGDEIEVIPSDKK